MIVVTELKKDLEKAIKMIKVRVAIQEQEELNRELNKFLHWLEPMLAVDTSETEQVLAGYDAVNVMREDSARQNELAELQEVAPDFAGGFYLVPPIIE